MSVNEIKRSASAAVAAGIVGAIVSLVVETPINWLLFEQTPWAAMRMAAAIVLGPDVLAPPATFDPWFAIVATIVHVGLAIACALLLAVIVHRMRTLVAAFVGALFGVVVYFINLHGFASLWFPWFAELRGGVTIFSHVVLGSVIGASYVAMRRRAPAPRH